MPVSEIINNSSGKSVLMLEGIIYSTEKGIENNMSQNNLLGFKIKPIKPVSAKNIDTGIVVVLSMLKPVTKMNNVAML
jgi:hypothetical protein